MANNRIQIKRSAVTATPGSLAAGELAFSNVTGGSGVLFIGSTDGGTVVPIGGVRNPGVLTANQAMVVNATSGIDKLITANLVPTSIWVNGTSGIANQVLATNSAGGLTWLDQTAISINTSAQYTWTNTQTFQANVVITGNSTAEVLIGGTLAGTGGILANATTLIVGNNATNTTLTSGSLVTGAPLTGTGGFIANVTHVVVGNNTVNTSITQNGINCGYPGTGVGGIGLSGSATTVVIGNNTIHTIANTTQISIGTAPNYSFVANTTTVFIGNSSVNTVITSAGLNVNNSVTANNSGAYPASNTIGTALGSTTQRWVLNANTINASGLITGSSGATITGTTNTSVAFNVGAPGTGTGGFTANTTTVLIGNNTVNTTLTNISLVTGAPLTGTGGFIANVTTVVIGNNTVNATLTSAGLVVNNAVTVNSTGFFTGSATDTTTGTGALIANDTTLFVGNNTSNAFLTTSGLSINAATIANTLGVFSTGTVNAATHSVGTNFVANTTTLSFTGANATFSGANLTVTGTNTYISANLNLAGALNTLGGTNTYVTSNVTITGSSITATSSDLSVRNATVSGNLIVSGTVVSVNTTTLMVNDNIIELGDNNTTTDAIDTGFYSPAGNATNIWYSGIVRQAAKSTNANPYFWLFGSNTNPNTATTVDITSNSSTGTLQAYLVPYGTGGAFVANSSTVTITANSTVSVALTANTLSLSTALPGTSGGTGKATVANNSLLVGNSSNGYTELTFNTTNGYVLQSNGTAIVYDVLDGGSF